MKLFVNRGARSGIDEEDIRWALTEGAVIPGRRDRRRSGSSSGSRSSSSTTIRRSRRSSASTGTKLEGQADPRRVRARLAVPLTALHRERRPQITARLRLRACPCRQQGLRPASLPGGACVSPFAPHRHERHGSRPPLQRGGRGGILAVVYLLLEPSTVDLAAQTFRADLFDAHGLLLWNNYWYGGHDLPATACSSRRSAPGSGRGWSARSPSSLRGPFRGHRGPAYADRAWLGSLWFGAATATMLLAAASRSPSGPRSASARCSPRSGDAARCAASPRCRGSAARWRASSWPSPAARSPHGAPSPRGPPGGRRARADTRCSGSRSRPAATSPFVFTRSCRCRCSRLPRSSCSAGGAPCAPASCSTPASRRRLQLHTQVGGNATRLGALFAGPVLALGLAGRRPVAGDARSAAAVVAVVGARPRLRAAGGTIRPDRRLLRAADRRARAGHAGKPIRVEIPPTRNRWEAEYVAAISARPRLAAAIESGTSTSSPRAT